MTMRLLRPLALLLLLPPLAGCGSLLGLGPSGPPARQYSLSAPHEIEAATAGAPVSWQLLVETPASGLDLNTTRIAVAEQPGAIDYFANVIWNDRAPALVQSALVESFEKSRRIPAVGRSSSALRSDYLLNTDLRDFQAETFSGSRAHVRLAARLVRASDRAIIASDSFEATVPAASDRFEDVIAAFDKALGDVLRRTVDWTLARGTADQNNLPSSSRSARS